MPIIIQHLRSIRYSLVLGVYRSFPNTFIHIISSGNPRLLDLDTIALTTLPCALWCFFAHTCKLVTDKNLPG